MCGICGFTVPAGARTEGRASRLREMIGLLAHRGPDDAGHYLDHAVGLGYRRLAIVDRAGGRQPLFNEEADLVLVYNGELYNYRELRSQLEAAGHRFRTAADTETVVHLYEEYGEEAPAHMRGMFAFAIWDLKLKKLFLARDRLGIKPLYYTLYGGDLSFASEVKALLALPGLPVRVNPRSIGRYLSFRFVPGPETMFEHILKLQPGHTLTYHCAGKRAYLRRYWRLEDVGRPQAADDEEYVATVRSLLGESVSSHLTTEVPVGCFLSGGLDSSSIVALADGFSDGSLTTFATGFTGHGPTRDYDYAEFDEARMVSRHFGTDHHEVRLSAGDITGVLPQLAWHLDEPLGDPTAIPLFFLAREARKLVTVALLGEGADELFAGYDLYRTGRIADRFRLLPPFVRRRILAPLEQAWPDGMRGKDFLRRAGTPVGERYFCAGQLFNDREKLFLLDPALAGSMDTEDPIRLIGELTERVSGLSSLDQMLYLDTMLWLPDDVLLKVDKVGMAHALELRVPFLDHRLVEFAFAMPPELKMRGRTAKYVLRRAMAPLLPAGIANRPKVSFPVPITDLMARSFHRWAADLLTAKPATERGYYSRRGLDRLLAAAAGGRNSSGRQLFALVMLELWHQTFIDRRLQVPAMADRLRGA